VFLVCAVFITSTIFISVWRAASAAAVKTEKVKISNVLPKHHQYNKENGSTKRAKEKRGIY
jgi:hypothetical protein